VKRTVRKGKAALLLQDEAALLRAQGRRSLPLPRPLLVRPVRLLPLLKALVPGKSFRRSTTKCSLRAGRVRMKIPPGKKSLINHYKKTRGPASRFLISACIYPVNSAKPQTGTAFCTVIPDCEYISAKQKRRRFKVSAGC